MTNGWKKGGVGWGDVTSTITLILDRDGPMTRAELADATGYTPDAISQAATRMRRHTAKHPKRLHIERWVREHDGAKDYPRPVYALGDGRCAPRPKRMSSAERQRICKQRKLARASSSIFALGDYLAQRRAADTDRLSAMREKIAGRAA